MGKPTSHAVLSLGEPLRVPVPAGLSPWAGGVWQELLRLHDFEQHELIIFRRALEWWDRADAAALKGDMKMAIDCASAALRHWRVLKFPALPGTRRPGRQPGAEWSPERR